MRYAGGAVLAAFALAVGIIIGQDGEPASTPSPDPTPEPPREVVAVPPDDICAIARAKGHDPSPEQCAEMRRIQRLSEARARYFRNRTNNHPSPGGVGSAEDLLEGPCDDCFGR